MLKYKCLVLDHDDTVVQSEATVNYPCFVEYMKLHRPGVTVTLRDYVSGCSNHAFTDWCRLQYGFSDKELEAEYQYWKAYAASHIPAPYPGIGPLLHRYRAAGGLICVSSMSAQENILRDYRAHYGLEPDMIFGWDLLPEQRKPNPYALHRILEDHALSPAELLMVDDMKFAVPMARSVGVDIAFAGWGRVDFPDICGEMEKLCDHSFYSTESLEKFLFD